MLKYIWLQLKRQSRALVIITSVTLLLVIGISVLLTVLTDRLTDPSREQKFRIAMCGDTDGEYISLGLGALETLENTDFSLEVLVMSEEEAREQLYRGELMAYAVLPESFIENAVAGEFSTVRFVTSAGQRDIVSMFKNEVAYMITDLVVYSQKGSYGVYNALTDNNTPDEAGKLMNRIAIEYAELVLERSGVYSYRELGVSDGLAMGEYYICALSILFVMIMGVPFACVNVRRDRSLDRILLSRGCREWRTLLCEYAVHALCMLSLSAMSVAVLKSICGSGDTAELLGGGFGDLVLRMIPTVLMVSALNMLMFELFDSIVSGVVMHFFAALSLCYISGCMYPVSTLPESMQRLSGILPAGIARAYGAGAYTRDADPWGFFAIVMYTLGFLCAACLVRVYKTRSRAR